MNKSSIDYVRDSGKLINRPGYTLNLVTGCKHGCEYCYARKMVEEGRLKGHPSYPYGFEPTYHPERFWKYGGKPKLIFLNNMGDVGGEWSWKELDGTQTGWAIMAGHMAHFARLNHGHIILLLTKNPKWYGLVEWPENVIPGFSATNNEELEKRFNVMFDAVDVGNPWWASLEPWVDDNPPMISQWPYWSSCGWFAIGGLSGPDAHGVSPATRRWLQDASIQAKRFTKANVGWGGSEVTPFPREYPDGWRVPGDG